MPNFNPPIFFHHCRISIFALPTPNSHISYYWTRSHFYFTMTLQLLFSFLLPFQLIFPTYPALFHFQLYYLVFPKPLLKPYRHLWIPLLSFRTPIPYLISSNPLPFRSHALTFQIFPAASTLLMDFSSCTFTCLFPFFFFPAQLLYFSTPLIHIPNSTFLWIFLTELHYISHSTLLSFWLSFWLSLLAPKTAPNSLS